jgi:hypothetical protein
MGRDSAWGRDGSVSPLGDGNMTGVRVFRFLVAGLAGALVFICLAFAVAVYEGKAFRRVHRAHVSPGFVAIVIIVVGIGCLVVAKLFERPLNGGSDSALVASYRSRFFLWVGLGETPFFLGVAFVAVTDWFWPCLVGAAFAVIAYWRIAPTTGALARDQARVNGSGSSRSLVAALATMPTRATRLR